MTVSLRDALDTLDGTRLKRISDFWGFDPSDAGDSGMAEFLYPRLQTPRYVRAAFERLPAADRLLVLFAVAHGGVLDREEIRARCLTTAKENGAGARLDELADKGFLFETDGDPPLYVVPDALLSAVSLPPHWTGFLGLHLAGMKEPEFRGLYELALGMEEMPEPARARWQARRYLLNPKALQDYLDRIPGEEAEMFMKLCRRRGSALYRDLLDLESARHFDHARCEHLNSLVANRGLVYVAAEGSNKYGNLLVVPRDLWQVVDRGFKPDKRTAKEIDAAGPSAVSESPFQIRDNSHLVLRDIVVFASTACAASFRKLAQGRVSRKDFQRLPDALATGRPASYLPFLATFLIDAGHLLDVRGRWKLAEGFASSVKSAGKVYEAMLRWWISTQNWDDSTPDDDNDPAKVANRVHIDPIHLRRAVLEQLASLPGDRWININNFIAEVLPVLEAEFARRSDGRNAAIRASITVATAGMISGPLHWLGLVDLGFTQPASDSSREAENTDDEDSDAPARKARRKPKKAPVRSDQKLFRLSQVGAAVLQKAEFNAPESISAGAGTALQFSYDADWIVVQPNHEIMAPPDLNLSLLFRLVECCDIRSIDVMTIVDFNRDSLRRSLDRGQTGDSVLEFFRKLSRTGTPETIVHLIGECTTRHGEAIVGTAGGYIRVDDPVVMDEIRSNPRLAKQITDLASPTIALLAPETEPERVARELRAMGLLPKVQSDTVHKSSDDRYHLSLTPEEMVHVIAAVRLVSSAESELNAASISEGKAQQLLRKLLPDSAHVGDFARIVEAAARGYEKEFKTALEAKIESVEEKYKSRVSRLVGRNPGGRGLSKYHFQGPNPAVDKPDILAILKFACDHELEVEVQYLKKNDRESRVTLTPKGFEGGRLYAHCLETETDGMYSVERVLRALLV